MTPLIKMGDVYFKREDQNLTGSAKDRSLELQIKNLIKNNYLSAVISSTGNAAISAQYFCHKHNINLTVFVSPHTDKSKLKLIAKYIVSHRPISDAFKFAKNNHAYLLRQSTDPTALRGYSQITTEIIKQYPNITDALSIKLLPLKNRIVKSITNHSGQGIVVQNKQVLHSQQLLKSNNIFTSSEGALALAGFNKIKSQINIGNFPVIILTGAKR